ncbi:MAG: hypothetical protein M1838_001452 [Thelocarpon superellum]|nr:MAG: hypothetical protein M1838_001452 [Thelocarpon superellum]
MPAGRPRLHRTEEEALNAQRASKRRYAQRARKERREGSDRAPPSPATTNASQASLVSQSCSPARTLTPELAMLPRVTDLELLHHFSTVTCFTLSDLPAVQSIWQIVVPQEGFSQPFLLRGILALSAQHLAMLRPDAARHYQIEATMHQDAALGFFRPALAHVRPANCNTLFALSALLVILAFASPTSPDTLGLLESVTSATGWLQLIRGSRSLLLPTWEWIQAGQLRLLCRLQAGEATGQPLTTPTDVHEHLAAFRQHCVDADESSTVKKACTSALDELEENFQRMESTDPDLSRVNNGLKWPSAVLPSYVELLEQRHAKALIILAQYSVLLHRLDSYWWIHGWSARILSTVHRMLDPSLHHWLDWPLSAMSLEKPLLP